MKSLGDVINAYVKALAPVDLTPYESEIEIEFATAIAPVLYGIEGIKITPQVEFQITPKISFRADFLIESLDGGKKVIVECDGKEFHSKHEDKLRDMIRDAMLISFGAAQVIFRISGEVIYKEGDFVADVIKRLVAGNPYRIMIRQPDSTMSKPEYEKAYRILRGAYFRDHKWLLDEKLVKMAAWFVNKSTTGIKDIYQEYLKAPITEKF